MRFFLSELERMKLRFFSIPVRHGKEAEDELNAFLGSHRIVAVDRRFVDCGLDSYWAVSVEISEGQVSLGRSFGAPGRADRKVDYREVLEPADFERFVKLRTLRKEVADREAVPVYAVFTNQQLADMVRTRVTTKEGLEAIEGVGSARVLKFGSGFLEVLQGMNFVDDVE